MNGFLAAFGAVGAGVGAVARIEDAGLGGALGFGIGGRPCADAFAAFGGRSSAALAAAAAERERSHAQHDDGPSRRCQALVTGHDEIPNAGRTIQRLPRFWRDPDNHEIAAKFLQLSPTFAAFSSRFSQALACAATFFGAVPP